MPPPAPSSRRGGTWRTRARGRRPAGRRRSPRPRRRARCRCDAARARRTTVPGGVWLAAFSSRLPSACSISAASTRTSGRSAGSSTMTRCAARRSRRRAQHRADDLGERRPVAVELRCAPVSRRVICSTLATCSDISCACSKMLCASACALAAASMRSPLSARLDEAPAITASGVRRSCEIEASSVLRMRSVSASIASAACACGLARTLSTSREITSATASMIAKVSRYCTSSTVNVPLRRDEQEVERRDAEHGARGSPARARSAAR